MELPNKTGLRIRELRLKRGLEQSDLADKLEMNRANISNYERGTAIPPGHVLTKLADIFSTSVDYLLCRTDDPLPIEKAAKNPDVRMIARKGEKMTEDQAKRMLSIMESAFPELFNDDEDTK